MGDDNNAADAAVLECMAVPCLRPKDSEGNLRRRVGVGIVGGALWLLSAEFGTLALVLLLCTRGGGVVAPAVTGAGTTRARRGI